MNVALRQWADRLFTLLALLSVALVVAALVGILLPILWRGSSAVVFRGTTEFRRMQWEQFNRGDSAAVRAEEQEAAKVRQRAYEMLDRFAAGLDTSELETKVKQLHRQFGVQIDNRDTPQGLATELKKLSKELRDGLLAAFETSHKEEALRRLDEVQSHAGDPRLQGTLASGYFEVAGLYRKTVTSVDLTRRGEYAQSLKQVKEAMKGLLGPRPGERLPAVPVEQYGATRWDQATRHLDRLLWDEKWTGLGEGRALTQSRVPREIQFAGTSLAGLFPYVRDNLQAMLRPQWTFYWRYFTDDNLSGHYFGGVGPEILGTLLLTTLAILVALPLGVVAAGYLVECAGEGPATKVLRMCINTLAGVPSIVFGLFGLAFFVMVFLPGGPLFRLGSWTLNWPGFGMPREISIVAGALTLALLVLPVVIRSSEEAIRTVPRPYKEASLALGASRFHCFMTVTLPVALPGILTGLILSMSRAAGETAPILCTAAIAMGPIPTSPAQPTRTLSYGAYDMAVGDKMAMLAPHNQFGMVMTLVAIVLLLNIVAIVIRGRVSRKLRGQ